MCIIVAKPMGAEMPDTETLERCFWANPDGAGFMYADGKSVRIRKGFMDFDSFAEALNEEIDDPLGTALVMHFRIATHGKVKPSTCHPFPVSKEPDDLKATRIEARFGVAHNGVIQGRVTGDEWSDTMDFVANVVAPLARMNPSFMMSDDALELLKGACRSKLAIMDNSGEIVTVGDFIEDDGVLYSNTSYMRLVNSFSSYKALWDYGYAEAYGTAYDDGWEDIGRLVEQLPYEACAICPINEECALTYPICEGEKDAAKACEFYESELALEAGE